MIKKPYEGTAEEIQAQEEAAAREAQKQKEIEAERMGLSEAEVDELICILAERQYEKDVQAVFIGRALSSSRPDYLQAKQDYDLFQAIVHIKETFGMNERPHFDEIKRGFYYEREQGRLSVERLSAKVEKLLEMETSADKPYVGDKKFLNEMPPSILAEPLWIEPDEEEEENE